MRLAHFNFLLVFSTPHPFAIPPFQTALKFLFSFSSKFKVKLLIPRVLATLSYQISTNLAMAHKPVMRSKHLKADTPSLYGLSTSRPQTKAKPYQRHAAFGANTPNPQNLHKQRVNISIFPKLASFEVYSDYLSWRLGYLAKGSLVKTLILIYLANKAFSSLSIDVFELFDIFSNSFSLSPHMLTWLLWMSITPPVQSSTSNATFLSPRSPSILSDEQSPKIPNYIT